MTAYPPIIFLLMVMVSPPNSVFCYLELEQLLPCILFFPITFLTCDPFIFFARPLVGDLLLYHQVFVRQEFFRIENHQPLGSYSLQITRMNAGQRRQGRLEVRH